MKRWIVLTGVMCMLMIRASSAAQKYTLKADLNGDNIVNFIDLAILSEDWLQAGGIKEEDLLQNATFSRSSIAFLDGKEYAPNAPCKKLMAVCSVSDLEIHGLENVYGIGQVILKPKCTAGGYIYASDINDNNIYRSLDGINWEQTTDALTGVYQIFGTQSGAILVAKFVGESMKLFRSTVGGSDLTDSNLPSPAVTLGSSGGYFASVQVWNFFQARNGTICLGEYGVSGYQFFDRSRIYRSGDDGVSFIQVYDEPDHVRHSHRMMKHEATGRWVNVFGDGAIQGKLVKSDDDGLTWSTLIPQMADRFHPTDFYDYGHPTNLLYGSDAVGLIGTLNVLNCKITPIYFDGNRFCMYVFSLYYHDGVFYAGTSNSSSSALGPRRAAILVSSDLVHWAVYHQFRDGEKGIYKFFGIWDDRIHGVVQVADVTWRHFSFSPTTVKIVNALCLDPATTNLLNTEQESSVETDTSQWGASSGTYTRTSIDAVHGSACLRVYGDGDTVAYAAIKTVTAGKTYNLRVWLKANGQNLTGSTRWYVPSTSRYGQDNYFTLSQDEWMEIVQNPVTILPGETSLTLHILASTSNPGPYDFLIDSAQYEEGPPTRWQVGGIPRTDETLSKTVTTPAEWTELISWAPECRSEWYANSGNQYIKSWCKDTDNYVELYFDPCDSTFAMQATVAGSPQTPIKSSEYTFYRNGVIRLAIRCDESSLRLSVAAAAPFEHVSGPAVDFLRSATLTSKTGDRNGTQIMSCTLLNDKLYHYVFADDELE